MTLKLMKASEIMKVVLCLVLVFGHDDFAVSGDRRDEVDQPRPLVDHLEKLRFGDVCVHTRDV